MPNDVSQYSNQAKKSYFDYPLIPHYTQDKAPHAASSQAVAFMPCVQNGI